MSTMFADVYTTGHLQQEGVNGVCVTTLSREILNTLSFIYVLFQKSRYVHFGNTFVIFLRNL